MTHYTIIYESVLGHHEIQSYLSVWTWLCHLSVNEENFDFYIATQKIKFYLLISNSNKRLC